MARAGVAISTLLAVGAVPVFAGAVGWAALRHRPGRRWALATVIAVSGLAVRSWGQLRVGDPLGVLMALTGAFAVGCYVVAAKAEIDRGAHPVELSAVAYTLGAVLLAPFALTQPLAWTVRPAGLAVALYLGLMTMGVGNLCTIVGMRGLPPGPTSTLLLSDPLVATLLGVVLLHEALPAAGVAGSLLVLTGLVLQARAPAPDTAPEALTGAPRQDRRPPGARIVGHPERTPVLRSLSYRSGSSGSSEGEGEPK